MIKNLINNVVFILFFTNLFLLNNIFLLYFISVFNKIKYKNFYSIVIVYLIFERRWNIIINVSLYIV